MKTPVDAKRLRRLRILAGLNQIDLAERAGVSKSQVSMVENGRSGLSPRYLGQIATVLGCDIADLLLDEDDPVTEPAALEERDTSSGSAA